MCQNVKHNSFVVIFEITFLARKGVNYVVVKKQKKKKKCSNHQLLLYCDRVLERRTSLRVNDILIYYSRNTERDKNKIAFFSLRAKIRIEFLNASTSFPTFNITKSVRKYVINLPMGGLYYFFGHFFSFPP